MGDPKRDGDEFLDDIEALEAEAEAAEAEEDSGGAGRAAPGESQESELDALRAERDDLKDRFMRALADAENARKRADKDRREAERYGVTRLARDLLPVYDNLQRAIAASREEGETASEALMEGVELTLKELLNVFHRHSIEAVSPQVGDTFDPNLHEAMFEAPVPNTTAGEIIQVSQDGFLLHDRLLRPAQVGVSSNSGS
ncbi:nucleotide exchange factor GrpE [Rhodosalinus sp.]|uniref:nucleotide exchange factor GrpE n=1 Tax=Rhodosalinus sp. TaxID=2047741 RepID=UPI0035658281